MKFKRRASTRQARMELTPLIDVVFLLLIFFMLSSSFVLQPSIQVDLPQAVSSEQTKTSDNVLITLAENGTIYIDQQVVSLDRIVPILKQKTFQSVLIQSDGDVPLNRVVSVWDKCRRAGIKTLNIATKQESL